MRNKTLDFINQIGFIKKEFFFEYILAEGLTLNKWNNEKTDIKSHKTYRAR
jgi:hypothetical protein